MAEEFYSQMNALIAKRAVRDEWIASQVLIPTANSLKQSFSRWVDQELADLQQQVSLLETIASGVALDRLTQIRNDLLGVQRSDLANALSELDQLINYLNQNPERTPRQVIERFSQHARPALSILFQLNQTRQSLDVMAGMVPPIPPSPQTEGDE